MSKSSAEAEGAGDGAAQDAKDPNASIYENRGTSKKIIRVLTVMAYMFSVSFAAILLSAYYVFLWQPPNPKLLRRESLKSEPRMQFLVDERANLSGDFRARIIDEDGRGDASWEALRGGRERLEEISSTEGGNYYKKAIAEEGSRDLIRWKESFKINESANATSSGSDELHDGNSTAVEKSLDSSGSDEATTGIGSSISSVVPLLRGLIVVPPIANRTLINENDERTITVDPIFLPKKNFRVTNEENDFSMENSNTIENETSREAQLRASEAESSNFSAADRLSRAEDDRSIETSRSDSENKQRVENSTDERPLSFHEPKTTDATDEKIVGSTANPAYSNEDIFKQNPVDRVESHEPRRRNDSISTKETRSATSEGGQIERTTPKSAVIEMRSFEDDDRANLTNPVEWDLSKEPGVMAEIASPTLSADYAEERSDVEMGGRS